ncbi:hypothetical protein HA402_001970 [Bradysia odoriphaga]|nr:hypothetical protein HA402_001970 [Bradysia odoriphaga]
MPDYVNVAMPDYAAMQDYAAMPDYTDAFVSSLGEKSLESADAEPTNETQLIDETSSPASFIQPSEDLKTNVSSGVVAEDLFFRNFRGAIRGINGRCRM